MFLQNITDSSVSVLIYASMSEMRTYQRDGSQQVVIGVLASRQLELLRMHWEAVVPNIVPFGFVFSPLILSAAVLFAPTSIADPCRFLLDHSEPLYLVAASVSYVAMIALGAYSTAAIGLIGLAMVAAKKAGYMPMAFDRHFWLFTIAAGVYLLFVDTISLTRRAFILASLMFDISSMYTTSIDPTTLAVSSHTIRPEKVLTPTNFQSESLNLRVNMSSVFAAGGRKIIQDSSYDIEKLKELFEDAESQNGDLAKCTGWIRLKKGVIEGKIDDQIPYNVAGLRCVLGGILERALKDRLNCGQLLKELAEIGDNCVTGWTRDCTFLLHPQFKEIDVSVHTILSKLRSDLIVEETRNTFSHPIYSNLGGENNAHLHDAFTSLLTPFFPNYKGDMYNLLNGVDCWDRLGIRLMGMGYALWKMFNLLPNIALFAGILPIILREVEGRYKDEQLLIDRVYMAIYPNCSEGEFSREIDWDAITSWLGTMNERGMNLEDHVLINDSRLPYLSKEGVKLLLWDLGTLELS